MKYRISRALNLGAAIALLLLGLAGLSIIQIMQRFSAEVTDVYHAQMEAVISLATTETATWKLRYSLQEYPLGDAAARQRIRAQELQWHAIIQTQLAHYAKNHQATEAEQTALTDFQAALLRYKEARPKYFELVDAGRLDDAQSWSALTTTPYGAALVAAVEQQIALEQSEVKEVQQHAADVTRQARTVALAVAFVLLLVLLGSYVLVRYMLRPLTHLSLRSREALRQLLGSGYSDTDPGDGGNEVVQVTAHFDLLVSRFTQHIAELLHTQQALQVQRLALEDSVAARTAQLRGALDLSEHQATEIKLRSDLSDMLQSCQDVSEAAKVVERYLPRLFPAAAGALYLDRPGHDTLSAVAAWGPEAERPVRRELEIAECWGLRRGKTYHADHKDGSLHCAHTLMPAQGTSLCVPLSAHGVTLGLLYLVCTNGADEASAGHCDLRADLAESVAALVGLVVATLRLSESLRQQAIRDALTGLFNRRHLESTLPRELSRAVRAAQPLAVIMLDVDHFKRFNDTHGHEAGDAVLRAFGRALRHNCRQSDTACRFGGEEFTVLLPDTDEQTARDWGERLRQRLLGLEVKAGATVLPRVTISMGLALHPVHGLDSETLLQAADLALYDAKHAGRDRLMVSGEATADQTEPAHD